MNKSYHISILIKIGGVQNKWRQAEYRIGRYAYGETDFGELQRNFAEKEE